MVKIMLPYCFVLCIKSLESAMAGDSTTDTAKQFAIYYSSPVKLQESRIAWMLNKQDERKLDEYLKVHKE